MWGKAKKRGSGSGKQKGIGVRDSPSREEGGETVGRERLRGWEGKEIEEGVRTKLGMGTRKRVRERHRERPRERDSETERD